MITKKKAHRSFPTIVIFSALVVSFLANFYDFNYVVASNTLGYSFLFNLVILQLLKKLKYCIYTILAMATLTIFNCFNLANELNFIDYDTYYLMYDTITIIIMFLTMLIYSVKK